MKIQLLRIFAIVFLSAVIGFFAIDLLSKPSSLPSAPELSYTHRASVHGTVFFLAVADTEEEWTQGLSGQESLPLDNGLLFLFGDSDYYGIWMKDMNFAIDVWWLDETGKIVFIKEAFSPESFPETIRPPSPAAMVIELPAGTTEKQEIKIGDRVIFN